LIVLRSPLAVGVPRPAPQAGEIVVFHRGALADAENGHLIKRVIGVPGDLVQIEAGWVFDNGADPYEPYVLATDD
jgi:signal peptidase I